MVGRTLSSPLPDPSHPPSAIFLIQSMYQYILGNILENYYKFETKKFTIHIHPPPPTRHSYKHSSGLLFSTKSRRVLVRWHLASVRPELHPDRSHVGSGFRVTEFVFTPTQYGASQRGSVLKKTRVAGNRSVAGNIFERFVDLKLKNHTYIYDYGFQPLVIYFIAIFHTIYSI